MNPFSVQLPLLNIVDPEEDLDYYMSNVVTAIVVARTYNPWSHSILNYILSKIENRFRSTTTYVWNEENDVLYVGLERRSKSRKSIITNFAVSFRNRAINVMIAKTQKTIQLKRV